MPLDAAQQRAMMPVIARWRSDPTAAGGLPGVRQGGLAIIDRSARPYAEWYALTCAACGLDETLHVALGPSVPTLD